MSCSTASASRRWRRLPGMAERTIKIGSAGKIFSLTGWKVGWMVAAPEMAARRRPGAPVPDLRDRAEPAGGGRLRARARAMPGSSRCAQRFARARDRMTRGPARRPATRCSTRPRPISCASTSTASGIDADDESLRHGGGRAGGRRGRAAVGLRRGQIRRATWSGCASPSVTRRSTPGSRRWPRRKGDVRMSPAEEAAALLKQFGVDASRASWSAIRRSTAARSAGSRVGDPGEAAARGRNGVPSSWRTVPAPRRGELVRLLGEELRAAKEPLARLVTLEAGKIVQEGLGEVQEMIDICDFAVGLSRQLYGLTIASERPDHRMMEQWHPLGPGAGDQRVQFPGRGVGVERGAGAGLRRSGDLEAEREDAADRGGGDGADAARARAVRRCAGRAGPAGPGRPRGRRGAGRRSAHRAGLGDRIDGDGPRGRPARRAALRPRRCSSSAATMR